jgi:hypothetical protein
MFHSVFISVFLCTCISVYPCIVSVHLGKMNRSAAGSGLLHLGVNNRGAEYFHSFIYLGGIVCCLGDLIVEYSILVIYVRGYHRFYRTQ